jgi:RNA polymerase primary sigma factor
MNRPLSPNGSAETTFGTDSNLLGPVDSRLIAEGHPSQLQTWALSDLLHAVDEQGNTPLHLAARRGSLAVCDIFIRAGASPTALNRRMQTPADAASVEGHQHVAQLLASLMVEAQAVRESITHDEGRQAATLRHSDEVKFEAPAGQGPRIEVGEASASPLSFEAEQDAEAYLDQATSKAASGAFVSHVGSIDSVSDGADWELDLSPAPIVGEGIGSAATQLSTGSAQDFLKVRKHGRRSKKRAVVQTGTRLSIRLEDCEKWVAKVVARGCFSTEDIEGLVTLTEGDGEAKDLRATLRRNLEAAGLCFVDQEFVDSALQWDASPDIAPDELTESIEAVLTRALRLPGIERFDLDGLAERRHLNELARAKQELHLGILASASAMGTILEVLEGVRVGARQPSSVSLGNVTPSRLNHTETVEFFAATESLKDWYFSGRVMEGKRRREALRALEALDMSPEFLNEVAAPVDGTRANAEVANPLGRQVSEFESVNHRLILAYLPYVRRFAARNTERGEDFEDVFQVSFLGLQRSTRRFDPERGARLMTYSTFWMKQALTRWRADEGGIVRIPVHRHENLSKLDRALDELGLGFETASSDSDIAAELDWSREEVERFRRYPRTAIYPKNAEEWEGLLPEQDAKDSCAASDENKLVAEILAELPDREADVIRRRFGIGFDEEMTLEEIGQLYGVTRERIRQIEKKGLTRLSHPGRRRILQTLLGR